MTKDKDKKDTSQKPLTKEEISAEEKSLGSPEERLSRAKKNKGKKCLVEK